VPFNRPSARPCHPMRGMVHRSRPSPPNLNPRGWIGPVGLHGPPCALILFSHVTRSELRVRKKKNTYGHENESKKKNDTLPFF
jgi:hypothetical protein